MSKPPKIRYPYRFVNPTSAYPDNRGMFVIMTVYSREHYTQILSAGAEGAMLLYPDNHQWVSTPLMEANIMSCDEIAGCLLSNEDFKSALADYLINNQTFLSDLASRMSQNLLDGGNRYLSTTDEVKDLKSESSDKDVIWGACFEVTEFWLDLLKTLCFLLNAFGDVQDLVNQLYSKDKNKRYQFEAEDAMNNPHTIGDDGEIVVGDGGEWEFIPNFLGQLVYGIAESTMFGFLAEIAGLGADLILADITDTRAESIACKLFNEIVCFDGVEKTPPFEFNNDTIFITSLALITSPLDVGLAGVALGTCLSIAGVMGEFISAFPIDETHRNFRIGMRSPSSEWVEICDTCGTPVGTWEHTFDFTVSDNSTWWDDSPSISPPNTIVEATTYLSGSGWGDGRIYDGYRQRDEARIEATFDSRVITGFDIEYQGIAGSGGTFQYNNVTLRTLGLSGNITGTIVNITPSMTLAGIYTKTNNFGGVETNRILVAVSGYQKYGNVNPQGTTIIRKVTLRGLGTNPFV